MVPWRGSVVWFRRVVPSVGSGVWFRCVVPLGGHVGAVGSVGSFRRLVPSVGSGGSGGGAPAMRCVYYTRVEGGWFAGGGPVGDCVCVFVLVLLSRGPRQQVGRRRRTRCVYYKNRYGEVGCVAAVCWVTLCVSCGASLRWAPHTEQPYTRDVYPVIR